MKRYLTLLLSVGLLSAMLTSCTSPLDANGPRIETPLTPAPKVSPQSIDVTFNTANGVYEFQGLPVIELDTTVHPMRVWMDFDMVETTAGSDPLIQEFRVNIDSIATDGLIQNLVQGEVKFLMDVGDGLESFDCNESVNTASILVAEHPYVEGEPRTVTITIYLIANKDGFFDGYSQEQVLGTIDLVI